MYSRKSLGMVIRFLRKNRFKLGQDVLSRELGISQSALSKVENGSLELGTQTFLMFLDKYEISPNDFKELVDSYEREIVKLPRKKSKPNDHLILLEKLA